MFFNQDAKEKIKKTTNKRFESYLIQTFFYLINSTNTPNKISCTNEYTHYFNGVVILQKYLKKVELKS